MKNCLIICFAAFLAFGCEPEFESVELKEVVRIEPGDMAIVENNIKVAHIICYEPARCEQNNDTIFSAYFDEQGRLIELWRRFDNYGELFEYSDSSNWASKRIVTDKDRRIYDYHYTINPEHKLVTKYILEGEDSIAEVDYRYNDDMLVSQFGPDENNQLTYYQYDTQGLMTKRTVQFTDTASYFQQFGRDESNTAFKIVEDYYYYEGRLDSSVKSYIDVYGYKFNEPTIYKYRYNGLIETEDGKFKYKFAYGPY